MTETDRGVRGGEDEGEGEGGLANAGEGTERTLAGGGAQRESA